MRVAWLSVLRRTFGGRPEEALGEPAASSKLVKPKSRTFAPLGIPRFNGMSAAAPPLSWTACHPSTIRRFKAQLTCSAGHGLVLKNHAIDAAGNVYPSVVCRFPGCKFHSYVRLQQWDLGAIE